MPFDFPLLLILDHLCSFSRQSIIYCPLILEIYVTVPVAFPCLLIPEIYITVPFVFPCLTNFVIYLTPPTPPSCLLNLDNLFYCLTYLLFIDNISDCPPLTLNFASTCLFNFLFFCLILSSSLSSIIFSPPFLNHFVPFSVLYLFISSFLNHCLTSINFFLSPLSPNILFLFLPSII